jgi:hypothetical protein
MSVGNSIQVNENSDSKQSPVNDKSQHRIIQISQQPCHGHIAHDRRDDDAEQQIDALLAAAEVSLLPVVKNEGAVETEPFRDLARRLIIDHHMIDAP